MVNEIRDNDVPKDSGYDAAKLSQLENCFYQGVADSHPGSAVAVSLCNGMQGVIETREGVYVVTPLPEHTVNRYRDSASRNSSMSFLTSGSGILAGKYHIVLKHNDEEFNDYKCPHNQRRAAPRTVKPAFLQHVEAAFESVRLNRTRRSVIKNLDSDSSSENIELNDLEIDSMNPKQPILYEEPKSRGSGGANKHRISITNTTTSGTEKTVLQVLTPGQAIGNQLARTEGEDKFNITVGFDTDLEQARKIIKKIGIELAADPEYAPSVIVPIKMQGVQGFGDYGIDLRMKMTTKPGEGFSMKRKFYVRIRQAFKEAGIVLPSPTVQVQQSDSAVAAAAQALVDRNKKKEAAAAAAAEE